MISPHVRSRFVECGASQEALEKLEKYVALIRQWNKAINLVAPSTIDDIWERHMLDSAQLWPYVKGQRIIDLGSGGGLPGLVLAMMGADHVTLIESDTRKCVFLREVSRETRLGNVTIINDRIEHVKDIKAPIITARALAPLKMLVDWSLPLLKPEGKMVFLKGAEVESEISDLPSEWRNTIQLVDSITDKKAKIALIRST